MLTSERLNTQTGNGWTICDNGTPTPQLLQRSTQAWSGVGW